MSKLSFDMINRTSAIKLEDARSKFEVEGLAVDAQYARSLALVPIHSAEDACADHMFKRNAYVGSEAPCRTVCSPSS